MSAVSCWVIVREGYKKGNRYVVILEFNNFTIGFIIPIMK